MTLIEKISADMTAAMRTKDQARLMPLRMAKAALMNREVEKGRALDEAEAQQVVASLIKQRHDSVEQFTKGGRAELAARETAEIAVLEAYVPPPLDPAAIEQAVDEAVRETGATAAKDMGRVMKAVMPKLAGRGADGRTINEIVRRKLGGA
ncbi:MAG: GatB/YqeY domain-containing protein [Acidobacteriota bacterium]|nr:GatB/YqeY domain-containing protein [Acidobacteriota bacterium]